MLLLFDIDGTLIRSGGAGRLAMDRAMEEVLGASGLLEGFSLAGKTDLAILGHALSKAKDAPVASKERVFAKYLEHLPSALEETGAYEILPGVLETLNWLETQEDYVVGLGTGNMRDGARLKLRYGGLDRYFSFGGFGDEEEVRAALLIRAWEKSKLHGFQGNRAEVLVIGDTEHDISAAKEAGMRVAAVATGSVGSEELAAMEPDLIWRDLREGLRWLREHRGERAPF